VSDPFDVERLRALNGTAGFNACLDMHVVKAAHGEAELSLAWRKEFGQYSGFLHAGVIPALLDTVAGFAAATVAGYVIASHLSVNFLLPAVGSSFSAAGPVVRAGKRQIFARSELFVSADSRERKLVATGEVLMLPA
jgi:uncharacterized protein (TIGR00369 family)